MLHAVIIPALVAALPHSGLNPESQPLAQIINVTVASSVET